MKTVGRSGAITPLKLPSGERILPAPAGYATYAPGSPAIGLQVVTIATELSLLHFKVIDWIILKQKAN
jgi:hypothetical protein